MASDKLRSVSFSVTVDSKWNYQLFDELSNLFISGNNSVLGKWNPQNAIAMNGGREKDSAGISSVWTTSIQIPENSSEIRYRYFIGRRMTSGDSAIIHVLKCEVSPKSRRLEMTENSYSDLFGKYESMNVSDGWLCDRRISEIRFSLLERSCIELFKPNNVLTSGSYRISMAVLGKEAGNQASAASNSLCFAAVINDDNRRYYCKMTDPRSTGQVYASDGHDLLTFRIQTSNSVQTLIFRFALADAQSKAVFGTADVDSLRLGTQGSISVDIFDTGKKTIGKLTAAYLVVTASSSEVLQMCNLEKSYVSYWKRRPPLDMGHRGCGNSYARQANQRENTLKSLVTAYEKGADFVEFDVQLAKDEVPILYHDFHICVEENGKWKKVAVKSQTTMELWTAKIRHAKVLDDSSYDESKYIRVTDREQEAKDPTSRAFPLLKDVLDNTPPQLGFNIEVKYPMFMMEDGAWKSECEDCFEINTYVDRILEMVMKYGNERRIVFSSFCPEICVALKLKQNRYPVLFLTQGVTKRYSQYMSQVTRSSEVAVAFALTEGLLGVSFHSDELLIQPDIIQKSLSKNLVSFVWGNDLSELKNIEFMKKIGVDGVIYDRIDELIPQGKRNIFTK